MKPRDSIRIYVTESEMAAIGKAATNNDTHVRAFCLEAVLKAANCQIRSGDPRIRKWKSTLLRSRRRGR